MDCVCEQNKCTGCGACYRACKQSNISMIQKKNGFPCAVANNDCHQCTFKCPQNDTPQRNPARYAYALQIKDTEYLMKSTSGGAFLSISKYVLDNNGCVYGAVYNDELEVVHKTALTIQDVLPMCGSKYVFSDFSKNLSDIKRRLERGDLVFVTGLPCQIAGIKALLGKNYENLLTADLICNGVPSNKLWKAFIKNVEKKKKIHITDFKFRDKHLYGVSHTTVIHYVKRQKKRTKTIKNRNEVSYYVAFGKQNCSNDYCYNCKYNTLDRVGDFTLGGFWAADDVKTNLKKYDGISLVLVNSDKAEDIINKIGESICDIELHPIENAILHNPALVKHTDGIKNDDVFVSLDTSGYEETAKKYFPARKHIINIITSMPIIGKMVSLLRDIRK